jgi:hypothetical protein
LRSSIENQAESEMCQEETFRVKVLTMSLGYSVRRRQRPDEALERRE